jgi:hypothetical protein
MPSFSAAKARMSATSFSRVGRALVRQIAQELDTWSGDSAILGTTDTSPKLR